MKNFLTRLLNWKRHLSTEDKQRALARRMGKFQDTRSLAGLERHPPEKRA